MSDTGSTNEPQPRRIAVVGSSGGNLYSHGGDAPARLLADISRQTSSAGFHLSELQFVAAGASLDAASQGTPAQLWSLDEGLPVVVEQGTLGEINDIAQVLDERIAASIESGNIDGLILVSADPEGVNSYAIRAAAKAGIPCVGTGGTSIAQAQQMGATLVSASGTTGTTSTTRAVAYVSALAKEWGVKYRPSLGSLPHQEENVSRQTVWKRISLRGIMVGSIPAFIAVALLLLVSKIPGAQFIQPVFDLLIEALPIVVAAVAARRISGLGEVGLVAGVIAGILSQPGGIIGGVVGGILAGLATSYLIEITLKWRFPATTANIVAGAFAGLIPGLIVYFLLAPFTALLGDFVKTGIEAVVAFNPLLAGALAGLAMWPAITAGVYHSVLLPLVLVEMAEKGHSFFGAVDMVSLVMVSLGITVANVVKSRSSGERALAGSGAAVNFFFGTFVEASYPFMFGDKRVFASALVAATAGGAVVGIAGVEATAYLPAFVAPFVSTNIWGMVIAMVVSFALAFSLTLAINTAAIRRARRNEEASTITA